MPPVFADVAADGAPVAASTAAAFAGLLRGQVAGGSGAVATPSSEVHTIRANCDAESCSMAIVQFDRHYRDAAGKQRSVSMQATALLSYDREASGGAFRIWHWHASRRPVSTSAESPR